jgi:hypothetical protein
MRICSGSTMSNGQRSFRIPTRVGANEGEATDDGHLLGAVAGSGARQIVVELDVEQPVHAIDSPVAARGAGKPFDVGGAQGGREPRVEGASGGVFGTMENAKKRLDVFEPRLARIGFVGLDSIGLIL